MYIVTDSCGTRQLTWTFKQALAWLPYCSEQALIIDRISGLVVAARNQEGNDREQSKAFNMVRR